MRRPWLLAAIVALTGAQTQAACLQPDEARTLFTLALPDAIDGLVKRCASALPANSFLAKRGVALAERYRREAPFDPSRARHAIEIASGQDLSFLADDDTVMRLAHEFVEHAVEKKVATGNCDAVDGLVELAAPLRADAMAEALMLALQLAGPDLTIGKVGICRSDTDVATR
jgi:hypothetical protein